MTNSPALYNKLKVAHVFNNAAQTTNGNSSAVDMTAAAQLGAKGRGLLILSATAKSGTFTTFNLNLQASVDGSTGWTEVAVIKDAADSPAANTTTIYDFHTELGLNSSNVAYKFFRIAWEIAGTTPSVTFSAAVLLGGFAHLPTNT